MVPSFYVMQAANGERIKENSWVPCLARAIVNKINFDLIILS